MNKIRFNQKLLFKIFLTISLATALTLAIIGFFSFSFTVSTLRNLIIKHEEEIVRSIMNKIDRMLYERYNDIQAIAGERAFENYLLNLVKGAETSDENIKNDNLKRLKDLSVVTGPWNTLFIIDTKGTIVFSTLEGEAGQSVDRWHYKNIAYLKAMNGEINHSDFVILKHTDEPTVVFSTPIKDENNPLKPVIGAVVGDLSWMTVSLILGEIRDDNLFLLNQAGDIIATNKDDVKSVLLDKSQGKSIIREMGKENSNSMIIPHRLGIFYEDTLASLTSQKGYLTYKGNGWNLISSQPAVVAFASAHKAAGRIILVLLPMIILMAGLILIAVRNLIVRPISLLTQTIRDISAGDLTKQAPVASNDEIGQLGISFNEMTGKLKELYENLEQRVLQRTSELTQSKMELEKRALEAKLFYEITQMAAQTDSLTEALQGCVNTICRLTSWPIGHIYIPSEDGVKELKSSKIWFIKEGENISDFKRITEETTFSMGTDLPGRIWQSGEPAWIRNVQVDGNFSRIDQCKEKRIKGAFGFPIKVQDKIVAVAEFFTNEEMESDENLLVTVRSVGEQLGRVMERKRAEKELGSTQAQLLQSEKMASIGQLAAGVAHEINNPVGFISNNMELLGQYVSEYTQILRMLETLKKSIEEGDIERSKSIVKEISQFENEIQLDQVMSGMDNLLQQNQRGVERIQKIVADLKTFAREGGDVLELVKIEEIIDSILSIVQSELKYKAELKKNYGDTPLVKGNSQKLGQVFINLFVNAVQAMEEKGTIEVRTYAEDKFVCVDVGDTGKGIAPENLKKIFDAFFTTKPVGQGTGLGLSVSYEIVKKHGGDIRVQSKVGKGTTFTIMLPVEETCIPKKETSE